LPAAPDAIVCYVTDRKTLGPDAAAVSVLAKIRAAVTAGIDWLQIREKDMPGYELLELARAAVSAATAGGTVVFVNDRLDVALAAKAAGVHLGRESLPAREVVRWCRGGNAPAKFRVGVSCHSIEEAREAERAGAAYIFFGPIFDTPSKREFGAPQGIVKLAEVCAAVQIPVIAIGGVDAANGAECIGAGAAGIAAIRMFQDADSAAGLREAIGRLHGASGKPRR
jgi:thiamine-phosphate pyrophosphorylase